MPDYRRYRVAGGTYFFTLNLLQRYPNDVLVRPIELLRTVVRDVRATWPFHIDTWVVLSIRNLINRHISQLILLQIGTEVIAMSGYQCTALYRIICIVGG